MLGRKLGILAASCTGLDGSSKSFRVAKQPSTLSSRKRKDYYNSDHHQTDCESVAMGRVWVGRRWQRPTAVVHNLTVDSPRMPGILRITHRQRRTLVSTLFGLTFFASILTVSASNVLPCPVRSDRNYHADSEHRARGGGPPAVVVKRPRRWIQERVATEH